jgi:hypothetical protein
MLQAVLLAGVVVVGVVTGGCAGPAEYDAEPDPTRDRQSASIGVRTTSSIAPTAHRSRERR